MFFYNKYKFVAGLKIANIVILCAALTACASSGNQTFSDLNKDQINNIISTQIKTKTDALSIFGEPDGIDFDSNGNEKLFYTYVYRSSKPQNFVPVVNLFTSGTDDLYKKVVLVFNKNGTLMNSGTTESKGETKTGLTD